MKEPALEALVSIAGNPVAFGVCAGIARWFMRARDETRTARQATFDLLGQIVLSCFVAYAAGAYLADETMADSRRGFYVCLAAFVARDVLLAVISVAQQFANDPFAMYQRVRDALRGSPK